MHATLENPARLHAAGMHFAFATGIIHNARNLTQTAGNTVPTACRRKRPWPP